KQYLQQARINLTEIARPAVVAEYVDYIKMCLEDGETLEEIKEGLPHVSTADAEDAAWDAIKKYLCATGTLEEYWRALAQCKDKGDNKLANIYYMWNAGKQARDMWYNAPLEALEQVQKGH
ncbi:MAG: hypothetical protein E6205_06920, partial [Winkia neuii]